MTPKLAKYYVILAFLATKNMDMAKRLGNLLKETNYALVIPTKSWKHLVFIIKSSVVSTVSHLIIENVPMLTLWMVLCRMKRIVLI